MSKYNKLTREQLHELWIAMEPKLQFTESCWLWCGHTRRGYGVIGGKLQLRAHCVSYVRKYGAIPAKRMVLHSCGKAACVNPKHLYAGTARNNRVDMKRHGTVLRGQRVWNSKLTQAQILQIRNDLRVSPVIAREYNVAPETIRAVRSGRNWNWVIGGNTNG